MKVSLASVLASCFVVLCGGSCNDGGITIVSAFTTPSTFTSTSSHHVNLNKQRRQSTNLYSTPKKKVLTAADVISKSKSTGGQSSDPAAPNKGETPKIFLPQIYTKFQSTLLLLEKRISNGVGSLSKQEVHQFENEINELVEEMKVYNLDPIGEGEKIKSYYDSLENDDGVDESVVDVKKKDDGGKQIFVIWVFCMFCVLCVGCMQLMRVKVCLFCSHDMSYNFSRNSTPSSSRDKVS